MGGNSKMILAAVVLVAVMGGLYFLQKKTPSPLPTTETPTPQAMTAKETTVALAAQNDSGESGTATLTEKDGKVLVTLALTGTPAGVSQPAHIHVGACPTPDAVKYPLTTVVDGKSETTLDVALDQLKSELPLAINVHKSASEVATYVSCGNLVF